MAAGVEDIAEGAHGELEDRSQVRAARAAQASRGLWARILEDDEPDSSGALGAARELTGAGIEAAGGSTASDAPANMRQVKVNGSPASDAPVRRGMVRYLYLLVDMTEAARQPDYRPRRHEFAVEAAKSFARRFLSENPLAEVGLVVLRAGTAEVGLALGSSAEEFCERVSAAAAEGPRGRMSLSSGLQRALSGLEDTPSYGTREVLILFASLNTFDAPETPLEGIAEPLQQRHVRVSVVSMSPEVFVLRRICTDTSGTYAVAMNQRHFDELMNEHLAAPECSTHAAVPKLVRMGFPRQVIEAAVPAACACHLQPQVRLWICPQCEARVCRVPGRCFVCELPLASSPVLARTSRQLLPPPTFPIAKPDDRWLADRRCCGCELPVEGVGKSCPDCRAVFCADCDEYIHTGLRQCPSCLEGMR